MRLRRKDGGQTADKDGEARQRSRSPKSDRMAGSVSSDGAASAQEAEYSIVLDKPAKSVLGPKPKLGIEVDKKTLVVTEVQNKGLVPEWNASNPGRSVAVGDQIIKVNSFEGKVIDMARELFKGKSELNITLRRQGFDQ